MKTVIQYKHELMLGSIFLMQIGSLLFPKLVLPEIAKLSLFAGLLIYSVWKLQAVDHSLKRKYN